MIKKTYLLFHLNILFSSVDIKDRKKLISKCYWPILYIAKELKIPINIEASARTIEEIHKLDKKFIFELKKLISLKRIYFVESGLNQIIAPIAPYEINKYNLELGKKKYKKYFNYNSNTALVNEMAYSESLAEIYYDAGYKNIILDIDNSIDFDNKKKIPFSCYSRSAKNKRLNIIWASSFMFQKFQNYVYGDLSQDEYIQFLNKYDKYINISLPLYSGDAETFNFRTNRFHAERKKTFNEWHRIYDLIQFLKKKSIYEFKLIPDLKFKGKKILSTITKDYQTIIVKKQPKYNIARWALAGRNNQEINTKCFNILKNKKYFFKKIKKKLFYETLLDFMGSDLRTHITKKRWKIFNKKLQKFERLISKPKTKINKKKKIIKKEIFNFNREGTKIFFKNNQIQITLNLRRGMSIDSLSFKSQKFLPLIGTINSENWKNIKYGADFYTGHFLQESLNPFIKITDLNPIKIHSFENKDKYFFLTTQKLKLGNLEKTIAISKYNEEIELAQKYISKYKTTNSIKMNNITFNNFKDEIIKFYLKNGGYDYEEFKLNNFFDQTTPPTKYVSVNSGLGCTNSELIFVIGKNKLKFSWDNAKCFALPMIQYKKISSHKLLRIFFSTEEYNETSKKLKKNLNFKLKISTS